MSGRIAIIAALVFAALPAAAGIRAADSSDARYLAGLRQRRLFELAEHYCREKLQSAPAGSPAEADLTLELIRTLAEQATHAPQDLRRPLWDKARAAAAVLLRRTPQPPRAILVRVQDALTPLAQGELARQEYEAGLLAADQLEPARQALREATSLLEKISDELVREIPLRRRTPPRAGELSADSLFGLQLDVQHQLARAQRNRALLAAAGSNDRRALLLAAIETLNKPLLQLAEDEPLRAEIELDLAQCQRLLGQPAAAGRIAAALDREGLPPQIRLRARAEQLRALVAQKELTTLEQVLSDNRTLAGQAAADLDFARFEALLALAAAAKGEPAAAFQEQAAQTANSLDELHGPYWGRRANQLLISALPRGGGTANVELLVRKAESLFLRQDFDQAIAAYDDAAAAARSAGNLQQGFDLAYKGALVEQHRGRHLSAASRLRILAKSLASHPQAPTAHLLAAWNAGKVGAGDSSSALYEELLAEHVSIWPSAESANQARLWQGKLAQAKGDWPAAIAAYGGVAAESPHFAAAALAQAELILAHKPARADLAEKALRAAIASAPHADDSWRTAANVQLVIALVQQPGREAEAKELLQQLNAASPAQVVAVVKGQSRALATASAAARPKLAEMQSAAIAMLDNSRGQLEKSDQLFISHSFAEALAAAGRAGEALAAYAKLAQDHPDSAAIQQGYAEVLLDSDDAAQLGQALDRWRAIATRSRPHSPRWIEAKYSVALAQFKLGDRAGAATLLQYILETPPGLKETAWQQRYEALLAKCGKSPTSP
jgi:hypothetical protein